MGASHGASPRDRYWSLAAYGVVLVCVTLCTYYIITHKEDFFFVAGLSFRDIVAASVLVLVMYLVNSYQLGLFLKHFGLSPGFGELVAITTAMLLGNLVLPMRGGSAGLAVYLKKVHKLDYPAFAAIYGGTAVLMALINTGMAMLGLIVLVCAHGFVHPGLSLFVAMLFAASVYLSVFPPPVTWKTRGVLAPILGAVHSWHMLTRNRRLLALQIVTILVIALAMAGGFSLIYRSLGIPLSVSGVVITSSLGNLVGLVPLTPGGLGLVDAVVVHIPQLYGLDPARSLAAALVFRLLTLAWACALGIPGTLYALHASRSASALHDPATSVADNVRR